MLTSVLIATMSLTITPVPATANGTLVLNGKEIRLTHATAFLTDGVGEYANDKQPLSILICDRATPPNSAGREFEVAELASTGKLHAFVVKLDPANPQKFNVVLYVPPKKPIRGGLSTSLSSEYLFEMRNFRITDRRVTGQLVSLREGMAPSGDRTGTPHSFKIEVTFDVPLRKPPAITATLMGEAAQKCAPVAAEMRMRTAFMEGDVRTILSLMSPKLQTLYKEEFKRMDTPEAKQKMIDYWKTQPTNEDWLKSIHQVVFRGDSALIITKVGDDTQSSFLRKIGGQWKSDEP